MRQHIPNALTLANLFCGCCALVLWMEEHPYASASFLAASFVFDYTDGLAARALGVGSPLGRELDSLADGLSFGAVPGVVVYRLLCTGWCTSDTAVCCWAALPAFVLTVFAAYRLGRFNIDTAPRPYFVGLSTPACTVFILGLGLAAYRNDFAIGDTLRQFPWAIYLLIALLSYLMASRIPMYGLKWNSPSPSDRWLLVGFTVGGALLWIWWGPISLSIVVVVYVLYSLLQKPPAAIS